MPLDSLYDLLVEELQDIYQAEHQLLNALPKMAAFACAPALKQALESHVTETEDQVGRLEQVFIELGVTARGRRCKGMEGLIEEGEDILDEATDDAILDTALIGAVRRIEHYEVAAYDSAASHAELLGEARVATLLRTSLEEEQEAGRELWRIAEAEVNASAVAAGIEETVEA